MQSNNTLVNGAVVMAGLYPPAPLTPATIMAGLGFGTTSTHKQGNGGGNPGGGVVYTVLGHPLSGVVRWVGANTKATPSQVKAMLVKLGATLPSPHTITTQLQHGRKGTLGIPALPATTTQQLLAALAG